MKIFASSIPVFEWYEAPDGGQAFLVRQDPEPIMNNPLNLVLDAFREYVNANSFGIWADQSWETWVTNFYADFDTYGYPEGCTDDMHAHAEWVLHRLVRLEKAA